MFSTLWYSHIQVFFSVFVSWLSSCVTSAFCWQHWRLFFQYSVLFLCHYFNIVLSSALFFTLQLLKNLFFFFLLLLTLQQPPSILFSITQAHLSVALHCCIMGKTELYSLYKGFLDCICLCLPVSISTSYACMFLPVSHPHCLVILSWSSWISWQQMTCRIYSVTCPISGLCPALMSPQHMSGSSY